MAQVVAFIHGDKIWKCHGEAELHLTQSEANERMGCAYIAAEESAALYIEVCGGAYLRVLATSVPVAGRQCPHHEFSITA